MGKRSSDTLALSGNGKLSVGLTFDDGSKVDRTFGPSGKPGVAFCPSVLLDSTEYFGLGEKDRVRYVFSLAKIAPPKESADQLTRNLRTLRPTEGIGVQEFQDALEAVVHELTRPTSGETQTWAEEKIKWGRDSLKLQRGAHQMIQKTVEGLAALELTQDAAPTVDVSRDLIGWRETYTEAVRRGATATAKEREIERLIDRRDCLRQSSGEVPICCVTQAELDQLRAKIDGYRPKVDSLNAKRIGVVGQIRNIDDDLRELETHHEATTMELGSIEGHKCCPTCKAKGDGWRDTVTRQLTEEVAKSQAKLAAAKQKRAELVGERLSVERELELATEQDRRHREYITGLRVNERILSDHQRALGAVSKEAAELSTLESRDLEGELEGAVTEKDLATGEINRATVEIARLEGCQKAHDVTLTNVRQIAQARLEERKLAASQEVYRLTVDLLESFQRTLVESAFGPILRTVNRLTDGILRFPLAYNDGEIGWFEGSHWIGHRTLSGCEKALAYAGISIALASGSPIKIILLDEVGADIDAGNKRKVVTRLSELITAGELDQAVLVDVDDRDYATMDGIEVVRLAGR